jgi:hypothetical protein
MLLISLLLLVRLLHFPVLDPLLLLNMVSMVWEVLLDIENNMKDSVRQDASLRGRWGA